MDEIFLSALDASTPDEARVGLPTEAEWEFACRAGASTQFANGDWGTKGFSPIGWMRENSGLRLHPVGQLPGNSWGLRDMHGNAGEIVRDYYAPSFYMGSIELDPVNLEKANMRSVRGGAFMLDHRGCRSASRTGMHEKNRYRQVGFRVALKQAAENGQEEK